MKTNEPKWAETTQIMLRAGFSSYQILLSQIWASRDSECPQCGAPPNVACRNLTGIRNFGFEGARENKYPHTERIDFEKLKRTLNERGYK